jgi:hypothetical protein
VSHWTRDEAARWYAQQPWLVDSNFTPASAVNQLEMWQAETFNPVEIDRELGWAAAIGMNTMRVYLHDLLWLQDSAGFVGRIDTYLTIAARHGIRTTFVLFDSYWNPEPVLGPQNPPMPGIHNSGWVQSPGAAALIDTTQHARLQAYVHDIVGAFADDERVLAWDIWNEPDNGRLVNTWSPESLAEKAALVTPLLLKAFDWAREAGPTQPLTSGIWIGDWSADENFTPLQRIQLDHSDVISFHTYGDGDDFAQRARWLERFGRPLLCTEYLARATGSTFHSVLPFAKAHKIGVFNWGLVCGKTQTHLPWESWTSPASAEAADLWFHDIFHADGTPYLEEETSFIRAMTLGTAPSEQPLFVQPAMLENPAQAA